MAENEVLDVRWGRRWKDTRRLLNRPDGDAVALADSACADALYDVQSVVKKGLQQGATLVTLFNAAEGSPAAMRAAVSVYPDQQLARFVKLGCQTSDTHSPADVAHATATLMFDRFSQRTIVFAGKHESWRTADERQKLKAELEQRRATCVSGIASILEKAIRGETIKRALRHRSQAPVTAKGLVERSLRPSTPPSRSP